MTEKITLKSLEENIYLLYGNDEIIFHEQKNRYTKLIENYYREFKVREKESIISVPGRTELSGNHTDHNGGKVIASSINLDTVIIFSKKAKRVLLKSDKYNKTFDVDLSNLEPQLDEKGTTASLIRGIAAGFVKHGFNIGGFSGLLSSDVMQGSGLSSSASIEITIGSVFNYLYNENKIRPEMIAKIGQFAENVYFGKPCGLMDQIACAVGGIVAIDFKDKTNPEIQKVHFNLEDFKYKLLVVDTGGTHQNLTDDYAAIPFEMKEIAKYFDKEKCSEIEPTVFLGNIKDLRRSISDRAILRTFHFFNENRRVEMQFEALKKNNLTQFLELVKKSGDSSFKYLQNIYSSKNIEEQPLSIALAITEDYLETLKEGACRVHGGGFAGTIQVFLPQKYVHDYKKIIEKMFGENSVNILNIRQYGPFKLY